MHSYNKVTLIYSNPKNVFATTLFIYIKNVFKYLVEYIIIQILSIILYYYYYIGT